MKKFSVGEPIVGWPVETWNSLVDAQAAFEAMVKFVRDRFAETQSLQHACVVNVVNKTGADVVEFSVLGIDNCALTPPTIGTGNTADEVILGGVQLECVDAEIAEHANAFVITLEPIEDDGTGRAVIAGATWARVDISDANHTQGIIDDSDGTHLVSAGSGGVPILWKATGTGEKWCVVQLGIQTSSSTYLGVVQSGGISAADWSTNPPTLGSGTVQPYNLDQSDIPDLVCPSGGSPATETWYNIAPSAIAEDAVVVGQDWQGIKIVTVETCDTVTVGCT